MQGILGGSFHFVRGDGNFVQLFLSVSNWSIYSGVGLEIGLYWLNRVEPSLTQWITGGVLHEIRGAGFHLMEVVQLF